MPIIQDFTLNQNEDGVLSIAMSPPMPIGGWSLQFTLTNRANGTSGLVQKYVSSGYNGMSGITVTNSGIGLFSVNLYAAETSGFNYGNYFYLVHRYDSGIMTNISEGFRLVCP